MEDHEQGGEEMDPPSYMKARQKSKGIFLVIQKWHTRDKLSRNQLPFPIETKWRRYLGKILGKISIFLKISLLGKFEELRENCSRQEKDTKMIVLLRLIVILPRTFFRKVKVRKNQTKLKRKVEMERLILRRSKSLS